MDSYLILSFLCGLAAVTAQSSGGTCNGGVSIDFQCGGLEAKFDNLAATIANIGGGPEWNLVFKAVAGIAAPDETDSLLYDPYAVWSRQAPTNEDVPAARQLDTTFQGHYKSSFALNWQKRNIQEVKLSLLDSSGDELISLVFDGRGTDHLNWFTRDRLLSSPYDDLFLESQNFFSVAGDGNYNRRWFINRSYGGCPSDLGWLVVSGTTTPPCGWEQSLSHHPIFFYSTKKTYSNYNTAADFAEASILTISVKSKSYYR